MEEARAETQQTRVTCDTLLAGTVIMAPVRGLAGPGQHQSPHRSSVLTSQELPGGCAWGHGAGVSSLHRADTTVPELCPAGPHLRDTNRDHGCDPCLGAAAGCAGSPACRQVLDRKI